MSPGLGRAPCADADHVIDMRPSTGVLRMAGAETRAPSPQTLLADLGNTSGARRAMFSGAQISLYPMAGNFVGIIIGALRALEPYRELLRIETDDLSTLLVGPPEALFPAMRDLFVAARPVASTGHRSRSATAPDTVRAHAARQ
jgi:hypothetical protein